MCKDVVSILISSSVDLDYLLHVVDTDLNLIVRPSYALTTWIVQPSWLCDCREMGISSSGISPFSPGCSDITSVADTSIWLRMEQHCVYSVCGQVG